MAGWGCTGKAAVRGRGLGSAAWLRSIGVSAAGVAAAAEVAAAAVAAAAAAVAAAAEVAAADVAVADAADVAAAADVADAAADAASSPCTPSPWTAMDWRLGAGQSTVGGVAANSWKRGWHWHWVLVGQTAVSQGLMAGPGGTWALVVWADRAERWQQQLETRPLKLGNQLGNQPLPPRPSPPAGRSQTAC